EDTHRISSSPGFRKLGLGFRNHDLHRNDQAAVIRWRSWVYSSRDCMDRSEPYPEFFMPPCGISVAMEPCVLIQVTPYSSASASEAATDAFCDHTEEARPYSDALAHSRAFSIDATGV